MRFTLAIAVALVAGATAVSIPRQLDDDAPDRPFRRWGHFRHWGDEDEDPGKREVDPDQSFWIWRDEDEDLGKREVDPDQRFWRWGDESPDQRFWRWNDEDENLDKRDVDPDERF